VPALRRGELLTVLENWSPSFSGPFLILCRPAAHAGIVACVR